MTAGVKITPLADATPAARRVAIGEFDGVHVGHRAVIAGNDTVLTFDPHPRSVVAPVRAPKLLTSLAMKAELVAALGVRELIVIPFDERFAEQEPGDFIDSILVRRLGATQVSVGQNFRFGRGQRGDAELLAADRRFATRIEPLVSVDGVTVSSSRIRRLLADGDVAAAARLLGAGFRMRGTVIPGDQRGRELGFPTANLRPEAEFVCPAHGVYACRVGVHAGAGEWDRTGAGDGDWAGAGDGARAGAGDGVWAGAGDGARGGAARVHAGRVAAEHMAATNVGVRPTFGDDLHVLVEPYLLDFSGDLYGRTLTLEFVERLRGERRFEDVQALVEQMNRDVERTRRLLA